MMRFKIGILLAMLFLVGADTVGQIPIYYKKLRPLEQPERFPKDSILLKYKLADTGRAVTVFLINRTADTITTPYYESWAHPDIEYVIEREEGNWFVLNRALVGGCFPDGALVIRLPPDHYLWMNEVLPEAGNTSTQVRFQVTVEDSLEIFFQAIPVMTSKHYLYPERAQRLRSLDADRYEVKSPEKEVRLLLAKAQTEAYFFDDYPKAIETLERAIAKFPDSDTLHFEHGRVYMAGIGQCKGASRQEKQLLLSAAYRAWNKLSGDHSVIMDKVRRYQEVYQPYLKKRIEWDVKSLPCREKGDKMECFLGCFVQRYIEVYFPEE